MTRQHFDIFKCFLIHELSLSWGSKQWILWLFKCVLCDKFTGISEFIYKFFISLVTFWRLIFFFFERTQKKVKSHSQEISSFNLKYYLWNCAHFHAHFQKMLKSFLAQCNYYIWKHSIKPYIETACLRPMNFKWILQLHRSPFFSVSLALTYTPGAFICKISHTHTPTLFFFRLFIFIWNIFFTFYYSHLHYIYNNYMFVFYFYNR